MFYLNCNSYLETSRTDRALYTSLKGSKSYCVSVPALTAPWSELEKRVFSTSGIYLFRIWVPAFAGPSTRCYCAVNISSKFLWQPWGFWNLFFIFQSLLPVKILYIYIYRKLLLCYHLLLSLVFYLLLPSLTTCANCLQVLNTRFFSPYHTKSSPVNCHTAICSPDV